MPGETPLAFELAGKRVWVAGHRGMVGSALVRRLAGDPLTVLVCRADRAAQGLHRLLGVPHSVEGV